MEHILKYEKLVSKIASKYSSYSSFEDLKQVGMIGLLKAVDNYKENNNTKFSTYAYMWIKADILDLHFALEQLPEEERKIINLRYFEDKTQSEVSRELGTNQVSVSRSESKILQKLRENIAA